MQSSRMLQDSRQAICNPFKSGVAPVRVSRRHVLSRRPQQDPCSSRTLSAVATPDAPPAAAKASPTQVYPSPAETARTVTALCVEGTLSTLAQDGSPLGTPVSFTLDAAGHPLLTLTQLQRRHLGRNSLCSLMLQPIGAPARNVASVTLIGRAAVPAAAGGSEGDATSSGDELQQGSTATSSVVRLEVERCLYFGGLDQRTTEIGADSYSSAEPDTLRKCASELVQLWNSDRAEDLYRIMSDFLAVQVSEMVYVDLMWVDRLGMYLRYEVEGRAPGIARVPFYRPVLDERDARSVITMASQVAWERERNYNLVPPPPLPTATAPAAS